MCHVAYQRLLPDRRSRLSFAARPPYCCALRAGISALIVLVEALGSETVVHARMSTGDLLLAVLSRQHVLRNSKQIRLTFDAADLHLFDSDGLRLAGT